MDASTPAAATTTPARHPVPRPEGVASGALLPDALALGAVRLRVADLDRSERFYADIVGLHPAPATTATAPGADRVLADADGTVVVELEQRDPAAPAPARTTGLYHVALLYPSREELARVVHRIAAAGAPVQGASDHGTHEAIYLPDPDGNGVELAADRPRADWPDLSHIDGIAPRALDLQDLLGTIAAEPTVPPRAAAGLRTGHLHLHVAGIEPALAHYVDALGFELVTLIDSAAFLSAGGYHHHLAVNTWRGVGAPQPAAGQDGLAWWSVLLPGDDDLRALATRLDAAGIAHDRSGGWLVVPDPFGIELRIRVAP